MAALAMERSRDVGLMKALGGSWNGSAPVSGRGCRAGGCGRPRSDLRSASCLRDGSEGASSDGHFTAVARLSGNHRLGCRRGTDGCASAAAARTRAPAEILRGGMMAPLVQVEDLEKRSMPSVLSAT